jgi:glycine oxidase
MLKMSLVTSTRPSDIVVIGAGLIGLAIALELQDRGANVTVIDRGECLAGASTAAAGMLAAEDPGNPPELQELSRLSAQHYPAFLGRLEALSRIAVPFQTNTTVQYLEDGRTLRLAEHSLDPRQLAVALRAAVNATSIRLLEHTQIAAIHQASANSDATTLALSDGRVLATQAVIYAAGAWTSDVLAALDGDPISITPCKGQMLRVRLPFPLDEVHRSERIYICPRTSGPQAGTALIGATVENAGFDTSVHAVDLNALRALAANLIPELASETNAPMLESWAGLRPATPDKLPILGACSRTGHFIATGHYRNGILQAPATALVMADLLEGKPPAIDVSALSPLRFACSATT